MAIFLITTPVKKMDKLISTFWKRLRYNKLQNQHYTPFFCRDCWVSLYTPEDIQTHLLYHAPK
jgi:hypothetical protein